MAKLITDWVKTTTTLPKWSPPAIAFGASEGLMLLLMLSIGVTINAQLAAQSVILSIISTAVAIGSTALQARTNPSTDTVKAQQDADATAAQLAERAHTVAQMQAADTADLIVQKVRAAMASNSTGGSDAHS